MSTLTRLEMPETAHPAYIPAFLGSDWCPMVDWSQRNKRLFMMHQTDGWMGGGMWLWTVIGVLVVVLLVVAINKLSNK